MANLLSSQYRIWILSGRSDVTHQATIDWLAKHNVSYDHLVMRPQNLLYMPDNDLKQSWLDSIGVENVAMVFDDRQAPVQKVVIAADVVLGLIEVIGANTPFSLNRFQTRESDSSIHFFNLW